MRTLTRILGENIVQQVDKQLSSAVSVSYPAASPETDVFGRKPDAQQMDKLFQDIQGTYASLYSISADIEGEFITKNVWIFDGFLPDQGVITGTFTSGIKKNTPLRMYVSHDRQTFYTLVFDGNDVIYDIVILHPLQLSTEIVIFYGISMGEATQDRFSIIGGKILLLPESKKSKMLPRRLGKSQLSDVVWNRLYSYFWDFGAGGSYIRAEPHWQTRKLGHDGVERLVDTGLPALMEEMLKHW